MRCDHCNDEFTLRRNLFDVSGRSDSWHDFRVCDVCAQHELYAYQMAEEATHRRFRASQLRRERKTKRKARCKRCSTRFWFDRTPTWPILCGKCAARIRDCVWCGERFETDSKTEEFCSPACRSKSQADDWWCDLPAEYAATRFEKLPYQEQSRRVLQWDPVTLGLPGIYAFGPSGCGKTRTLLLRLRRFKEEGLDVIYLRSAQFAREVIQRSMRGGIEEWLDGLREVPVLCLDEVEKLKFTERVQAEFFDLVEDRLSHRRVTIFAANVSPEEISNRMDPSSDKDKRAQSQYGPAFLRRITEFCCPVLFQKPKRVTP